MAAIGLFRGFTALGLGGERVNLMDKIRLEKFSIQMFTQQQNFWDVSVVNAQV